MILLNNASRLSMRYAGKQIRLVYWLAAHHATRLLKAKTCSNSAYFLYENEVKGIVHKTLLPNYDIFDEYRYFEPAYEWNMLHFKGKRLAVTVCEDIWNLTENPMYRTSPMDILIKQEPDLMINLSASPFDYIHAEGRHHIVRQNVAKYGLPMIYCNAVGAPNRSRIRWRLVGDG